MTPFKTMRKDQVERGDCVSPTEHLVCTHPASTHASLTSWGEPASYLKCCGSLSQNLPEPPHNRAYWFNMYPKQFHWSCVVYTSSLWEFQCNRRTANMSSVALPLKHCISLQRNTAAGVAIAMCVHLCVSQLKH